MKTIPTSFLKIIKKKEELKDMLKLGKVLSWGEIVELAEKEDKKNRKAAYYEMESSGDEMISRLNKLKSVSFISADDTEKGMETQQRVYTNTNYGRKQTDPATRNQNLICHWCARRGHMVKDCWKKLGRCIGCGSDEHAVNICPKAMQRKFGPVDPVCPLCSGPHFGKDCGRGLLAPLTQSHHLN